MNDAAANLRRNALVDAIHGVAKGDRQALRQVYDLTASKLFGICLRICEERGAAEDVLQTVYIKLWQRAGSFDESKASPVTWLAAIARNAALDWRRARRPSDPLPDNIAELLADESPDAETVIIARQDDARIAACIDGLEANRSAVIRSAFFEGLSYPEIAEKLGKPLGTVKSWSRRGLLQLRECLTRDS